MRAVYTRRRLLVLAAGVGIPVTAWARLRGGDDTATADTDLASPGGAVPPTASPRPPTTPLPAVPAVPAESAPPSTVPVLEHNLAEGSSDPKVTLLQQRLVDLGFDPGPVDGSFGGQTVRAVWAFEKLVAGIDRDDARGVVTPELWERLQGPVEIEPRRTPGGTHVEVYLPEQVAAVFVNGAPRLVTHVSTGTGEEWCQEVTIDYDDGTQTVEGRCGVSKTPGGVYTFDRKVDGWRNAALGRLYNPVYFNYGIAVHGASSVPDEPASRGCVRIPMHVAEYFPEIVSIGDTIYVFDGEQSPEENGAQLPVFDWKDPDWIPPSTIPETSVPPTTELHATTTTTVATPAPPTSPPTTPPPTTTPTSLPSHTTGTDATGRLDSDSDPTP